MNDLHTPLPDRTHRTSHEPWTPQTAPIRRPAHLARYAFAVAVILSIAFVIGLLPRLRQRGAVAATTRELSAPTVTVVSATPGRTATPISLPAEIRPLMEASINARATGYVKQWFVELGGSVTNGQALAELDTPEIAQSLAQAVARVNEAAAAQDLAAKTAARWEEMRKIKAISVQEADEKASELALRTAQLESARAEVRRLESLLGFAQITAPFSGTVTARRLDIGQLVNPATPTELYRVAQTATLRVFVRVPQSLAGSIAVGQTAEVTFNETPNRKFPARIVRTAGALDPASRTLLTELELPNPHGHLLPGSFAQVRFPDVHPEPVVTLPANTLLYRNTGPQIAIVSAEGRVELRPVTLGRDLGPSLEILSGVGAQDRVILNPADSIAEGTTVTVVTPAVPPKAP